MASGSGLFDVHGDHELPMSSGLDTKIAESVEHPPHGGLQFVGGIRPCAVNRVVQARDLKVTITVGCLNEAHELGHPRRPGNRGDLAGHLGQLVRVRRLANVERVQPLSQLGLTREHGNAALPQRGKDEQE
jgi:hypothetical protein